MPLTFAPTPSTEAMKAPTKPRGFKLARKAQQSIRKLVMQPAPEPGTVSRRTSLRGMVDAKKDTTKLTENILDTVQTHFPGSLTSADVLKKVSKVIEERGLTDDNTLFAQSVCPDEINHEPGDITNIFTEYLGEVFHMGGLGGIPFTGKTGFAAYSHHVPEDGHCFILMAPHIGLDSALNWGKYDRERQTTAGAACGAAIGALCHCEANSPLPDLTSSEIDYQMAYIIHKINQVKNPILSGSGGDVNTKQSLLAAYMHEIANSMLEKIVTLEFGGPKSTLTILTGIQINMPDPMEDYFQPLNFYTKDKVLGDIDLFEQTFGMMSPRKELYCAPVSQPVVTKPIRHVDSNLTLDTQELTEVSESSITEGSQEERSIIEPYFNQETGYWEVEC